MAGELLRDSERWRTSEPLEGSDDPGATPTLVALPGEAALEDVLRQTTRMARETLGMDVAFVRRIDAGHSHLRMVDGMTDRVDLDAAVALAETHCQAMLDGRLPEVVADTRAHPVSQGLLVTELARIGAYVGVPIHRPDGSLYGTFCCVSAQAEPKLREQDATLLRLFARLIGTEVDRAERSGVGVSAPLGIDQVTRLMVTLRARDGYTEQHTGRVQDLALEIGLRLGLDPEKLDSLRHAALLHDIGKIGIPDAILHKAGPLDEAEWGEMRRHPLIGEAIVRRVAGLEHMAPVVRAEHESWDGSGYPDGLAGEEIPLLARVVQVADAFHAMTSDRPYRRALSVQHAIRELRGGAGEKFCPRVTQAALELVSARVAEGEGPVAGPAAVSPAPVAQRNSDPALVLRNVLRGLQEDDMESALEWWAPEAEMVPSLGLATAADPYVGPHGVRRWREGMRGRFPVYRIEFLATEDLGRGHFLTTAKVRASGPHSGVLSMDVIHQWTIAGGRVHRMHAFADRESALRSAGLPGGPAAPGASSVASGARPALSPRESQILALVAQGQSNGEIGLTLGISAETVRTHLRNVLGKLGARTRSHAVALALRSGAMPSS